jgi:hypothetical protein
VGTARDPSASELARFNAALACNDIAGTIANRMAARAMEVETEHLSQGYTLSFASALLEENCRGGKALTDETRSALENLTSAPE